jgi:acyl-CoA synthetase (NDP forming)
MVTNSVEIAEAVARGAGRVPRHKPVLSVFLSTKGAPPDLARGPRGKLPSYSFPENAARALSAAERYGRWRARPAGEAVRLDRTTRDTVRAIVERAMAGHDKPFWLEPMDAEAVLRAAGIPLAPSRVASPDAAVAAAEEIGYPLVAKAVSRRLLHKSDVGGVVLGLTNADEVAAAVRTMRARVEAAGHPLESVLLQRQVSGGVEALVGVVGDPTFGPLIVCGLGGVQVELLRDASFRMPPVTDLDARDMIDRLKLKALFDGYRGAPPADRRALEALIQRVSALVEALPELQELDLNPVKVLRPGEGVVIVDARVRVGPAAPENP